MVPVFIETASERTRSLSQAESARKAVKSTGLLTGAVRLADRMPPSARPTAVLMQGNVKGRTVLPRWLCFILGTGRRWLWLGGAFPA